MSTDDARRETEGFTTDGVDNELFGYSYTGVKAGFESTDFSNLRKTHRPGHVYKSNQYPSYPGNALISAQRMNEDPGCDLKENSKKVVAATFSYWKEIVRLAHESQLPADAWCRLNCVNFKSYRHYESIFNGRTRRNQTRSQTWQGNDRRDRTLSKDELIESRIIPDEFQEDDSKEQSDRVDNNTSVSDGMLELRMDEVPEVRADEAPEEDEAPEVRADEVLEEIKVPEETIAPEIQVHEAPKEIENSNSTEGVVIELPVSEMFGADAAEMLFDVLTHEVGESTENGTVTESEAGTEAIKMSETAEPCDKKRRTTEKSSRKRKSSKSSKSDVVIEVGDIKVVFDGGSDVDEDKIRAILSAVSSHSHVTSDPVDEKLVATDGKAAAIDAKIGATEEKTYKEAWGKAVAHA